MITQKELVLSVHQLVDFLLRTGDIDSRVFNRSSMNEGTLLHALYQAKQGDNYISEYPLSTEAVVGEIKVKIQGRADGIIIHKNKYTIDEIKTTVLDLKEFKDANLDWHLGQAKVYAYMFSKEKGLDFCDVKLTYIRQGKESEKLIVNYSFSFSQLEDCFYSLINEYLSFYNIVFRKLEERNESIKYLEFPFEKYREGQRELAKYSYSIGKNGGKLFVEAPTGIGKTMSTLYPFIKSLQEDEKAKIFYLTAKNSGKINAHLAVKILRAQGLKINDILLTAKDKICFCKDKACNPDECPFAIGYYNKIKDIIKEALLNFEDFDYETLIDIAKTYNVCPFELELDLSLFADIIICDYNYIFDPISYLKRYFDEDSSHTLLLVDEAHNLVDRSKEMYSASLDLFLFKKASDSLKGIQSKKIKLALAKIKKMFEKYQNLEKGEHLFLDINYDDFKIIDKFINVYQEEIKNKDNQITKDLTNLYIECNKFKRISELMDDNFIHYINVEDDNVYIKIACLNASKFLHDVTKRIKGSIFFSATLSPIEYYIDTLGGDKDKDPTLILSSPFPKENLKIIVAPKISVRYKYREKSYDDLVKYIEVFVKQKVGNYFIYLPSYEYKEKIASLLNLGEDIIIHYQEKDMNDLQKELFLDNFKPNPNKTHVGILVIGGAFSEGIDLVNDRLIGTMIVGIGLGKINFESDKIAELFNSKGLNGFDYAYLYPGMNKVMQAVGRLIRSETDRGVAVLVEDRYLRKEYRSLFKKEWEDYEVVVSNDDFKNAVKKFYSEEK